MEINLFSVVKWMRKRPFMPIDDIKGRNFSAAKRIVLPQSLST